MGLFDFDSDAELGTGVGQAVQPGREVINRQKKKKVVAKEATASGLEKRATVGEGKQKLMDDISIDKTLSTVTKMELINSLLNQDPGDPNPGNLLLSTQATFDKAKTATEGKFFSRQRTAALFKNLQSGPKGRGQFALSTQSRNSLLKG